MNVGSSRGIRGAVATFDLPKDSGCIVGRDELISIATVRSMAGEPLLGVQSLPSSRPRIGKHATRSAAEDRALTTLLLLREQSRPSSPLMPYIRTFLDGAADVVPAAWDEERLQALSPELVARARSIRKTLAQSYADLVPAAIDALPDVLGEGLQQGQSLADVYSLERFTQLCVALRSRDFVNTLQESSAEPGLDRGQPFPAAFLVPLLDLMNHASDNNVRVTYDLKRHGFVMRVLRPVQRGEELTISYGSTLCRQHAMSMYGFGDDLLPCSGS